MRYFLLLLLFAKLSTALRAQVPVHEEPRHRPVFENSKVRLLNVVLPPGDTTQYHRHHTPSLFLFFTSTTTGSQLQGGAPSTGRSTASTVLFENLAAPHERIHRVWNVDQDTFHVMDVELLSPDAGFAQPPLVQPHLQLAVDTPWVRAYSLTVDPKSNFTIANTNRSFVIIAMDSGHIRIQSGGANNMEVIQPGKFFDVPAKQKLRLKNEGRSTVRFTLVELP